MCHLVDTKIFNKTANEWIVGMSLKLNKGISSVISDVDKIMKFFIKFRLKLSSSLVKTCPDYMKEVYGEEITTMAQTIHPFVTQSGQKVITIVKKYFSLAPAPSQNENASDVTNKWAPSITTQHLKQLLHIAEV